MSATDVQCVTVLGKGGVGRTTVAIGIARALAAQGRKVLLLELSGAQDVSRALRRAEAGYRPQRLAPGLDHASYRASDCLVDFGKTKLGIPALLTQLFEARPVRAFLEAIPGLNEVLQLGKMVHTLGVGEDTSAQYDTCVIDAPATGHGLTLLGAARAMRQLTRVGPFTELARPIEQFLVGASAQTIAVTTPEALPMEETERLLAALEAMGQPARAVVINRVPDPLPPFAPPWTDVRESAHLSEAAGWIAVGDDLWQRAVRCRDADLAFRTPNREVRHIAEARDALHTLEAHESVQHGVASLFGSADD